MGGGPCDGLPDGVPCDEGGGVRSSVGRGVRGGGLGGGGSGGDEEAFDVGGGLDEGEELVGVGLGSGGV